MVKNGNISNKIAFTQKLLAYLIDDPTRSMRQTSHDLHTNRQRVWRRIRALEDDNVIWGYTAVVDQDKLGCVMYMVLMKLRPMDKALVDLILDRLHTGQPHKQQVRLLNVLYVNGEYDLVVMFAAPDHMTARRYYDSLRISYHDFLLDKPIIADVNFSLIRESKLNPELNNLEGFIPV